MKYCQHISFDELELKYLVRSPAVLNPVGTPPDELKALKCSRCKTEIPIHQRANGAIRIKLL